MNGLQINLLQSMLILLIGVFISITADNIVSICPLYINNSFIDDESAAVIGEASYIQGATVLLCENLNNYLYLVDTDRRIYAYVIPISETKKSINIGIIDIIFR